MIVLFRTPYTLDSKVRGFEFLLQFSHKVTQSSAILISFNPLSPISSHTARRGPIEMFHTGRYFFLVLNFFDNSHIR